MRVAYIAGTPTLAAPALPPAICGTCSTEVIAKCGTIRVWHWSHTTDNDCDSWAQSETAWHSAWKSCAPLNRQEVTIGGHRADAIAGDQTIVEIQHSAIAVEDVIKREDHYGNMRWIFDAADKDFEWDPLDRGVPDPFRWKIYRKHSWHAIGACTKRVMLDFGDTGVLSLEKVNDAGTSARGYLYPADTIARWIAGPDYREGWAL